MTAPCDNCGVLLLYPGTVNCNSCGGALCPACSKRHPCEKTYARILRRNLAALRKAVGR